MVVVALFSFLIAEAPWKWVYEKQMRKPNRLNKYPAAIVRATGLDWDWKYLELKSLVAYSTFFSFVDVTPKNLSS